MSAKEAVEFLIQDHGDKGSGFRGDFAQDKPYKSLLQRQSVDIDEALEKFKWDDDCGKWESEYTKQSPGIDKLIRYGRSVCFCIGGWRELNEDFKRGDVSCLRDLRTPFVTSRSQLKSTKDEFDE